MIRGATGRGGSGKSIYTVGALYHLFKRGRDIVANTPLIDLRVKQVKPKSFWGGLFSLLQPRSSALWVPCDVSTFGRSWAVGYIHRFEDLYSLDNCECLIDEMGAWMPAHKYGSIPEETRRFLAQDRREGVNIWWTHRTQRIFHEVLDNTAEIAKLVRYGPLCVASLNDPQEPDKRPLKKYFMVSPMLYDLYDTYAKVGSADGKGYGIGKRQAYGGIEVAAYYECVLPCLRGGEIGVKIKLRPEQAMCLVRMYGPESVGLYRQEFSDIHTRELLSAGFCRGPVVVPGLAPPLDVDATYSEQLEGWK